MKAMQADIQRDIEMLAASNSCSWWKRSQALLLVGDAFATYRCQVQSPNHSCIHRKGVAAAVH